MTRKWEEDHLQMAK